MKIFLKCVAQAIMENGFRGLAAMVPGGEYAYDIAKATMEKYKEQRKVAEIREEIPEIARKSFEQAREVGAQTAREVAAGESTEDIISLELYLSQIPGSVRQSLKRADDPTGTTVPASFSLDSPDDILKLLPPRPVQFRLGDPLPGKPGWKLAEPLGVGGFGEVWLARHCQITSLTGAVKFCHDLRARDRELLHESHVIDRVMRHGKHPNIVPLLDANLEGQTPWLMFEYVQGGNLADVIHEWQNLPNQERLTKATTALHELAIAVGHFHKLTPAVVHRDLKPANILRDRATGKLRVTDFGIGGVTARVILDEETRGAMTLAGRLLSCLRGSYTPLYASPQQRDGGEPDPRDDVHALGVIGYQMITGQLNRGAGPDFADDLRDASVWDDLINLLGRCVAQRVERRPNDAAELAEQLKVLLEGTNSAGISGKIATKQAPLRVSIESYTPSFLLCQPDKDVKPGAIGDRLRTLGCDVTLVKSFDNEFVPFDSEQYVGLIVLGGGNKHANTRGAYSTERHLIKQALWHHKPVLGVGLGAQLLALECGGELVRGTKRVDKGWKSVVLTDAGKVDVVLKYLLPDVEMYQDHCDTFVFPAASNVVELATSSTVSGEHCEAFRSGNSYGLNLLCEVTKEILNSWKVPHPKDDSFRTAQKIIDSWIKLAIGRS